MDLTKIDYKQLQVQKAILINMIQDWGEADDEGQQKDAKEVEGIVHLIDAIQDNAVDTLGMSEEEVFDFKSEDPSISGAMLRNAEIYLIADEYTIREQITAIIEQSKVDDSETIDNVPKVQVWEIVSFGFSCKTFLNCIR